MTHSHSVRPGVLLACFVLPFGLMLLAFAVLGIAPFGEKSALIFDLSDQYVEFLCALKTGDVYFSWSAALGTSWIGTFSYYLSSPLSLLTLLCPNDAMPVAMVFLIAGKIGLSGLTFGLLLRERTGRFDLSNAAFALCYGLCAYNVAYGMSFMWLDGVIWLPVILMGVDRLDRRRPSLLLLAGLILCFWSTWYVSYMVGLFAVLYLVWRWGEAGLPLKKLLVRIARLAAHAALAMAVSAPMWLPTLISMFSGKLSGQAPSFRLAFNYPFSQVVKKLLLSGSYDSVTYTGSPFLYCSLLAAGLAVLYFLLPRLGLRRRLWALAMALVLGASVMLLPLDMVWHLFQVPNSFPCRYAFVVSCFMLLLAWDCLEILHPTLSTLLPRLERVLGLLLTLVLAADMTYNAVGILKGLDGELCYEPYNTYQTYKQTVEPLAQQAMDDADGFFRVANNAPRSRNDASAFGYNGITFFSSSYHQGVNQLLSQLGLAQAWFWCTCYGSTPVTDALLSVRYVLDTGSPAPGYQAVGQSGDYTLYYNDSALAPVLSVPQGALEHFSWQDDPLLSQNALLSALAGEKLEVFRPLDTDGWTGHTTLVSDGSPLYLWCPGAGEADVLTVNGEAFSQLGTPETRRVHYLGVFPAGTEVTLSCPARPFVYALDQEQLDRGLSLLEGGSLQAVSWGSSWNSGWLEGTVTLDEEEELLITVPADRGWTLRLDGQTVELETVEGALLSAQAQPGSHTFSLVYTPPGLTLSLCLSAAGLAGCILWLLVSRKRSR